MFVYTNKNVSFSNGKWYSLNNFVAKGIAVRKASFNMQTGWQSYNNFI